MHNIGAQMAGLEWDSSWLDPGWPVASCVGSLSLSFSICKMGISGAFVSRVFGRHNCNNR